MNDRDGLRRYLLGSASEGERERFEQDLLADEGLYEELLATEEELIDEYVVGQLPELEQAGFLQYLSKLPDYEKRLEFAQALRARSVNSQAEVASGGAEIEQGDALGAGFPVRASLVAAAAVLVMAVGGVWSLMTISGLRQEIALAGPRSFLLAAGTLRSGGATQVLRVPQKPVLMEIHLDLGFDNYETYRAVLSDSRAVELMSLSQLRARIQENEIVVAFSISSERFRVGDYYISLSGVGNNGELEPVARYDFRISSE